MNEKWKKNTKDRSVREEKEEKNVLFQAHPATAYIEM